MDKKKYRNVILFLISRMSDKTIHGKKKLAKLLYYVDFDRYEYKESMVTVTGDEYRHLPMGPVPDGYQRIVEGMVDDGLITVSEKTEYQTPRPTTLYMSDAEPDLSVFDEDDLFILERVVRLYGGLTGKELGDRSHEEAPWLSVDNGEHIPFSFAFYRDTDFLNAA